MKEFFGTIIIVILAFLAGFLAFWFRKFLLAVVALGLLLSGCDGGSEGDPNSPGDSANTFNPNAPAPPGECPIPTGGTQSGVTALLPVQFFTTSEPLSCSDDSLSTAKSYGVSCTDLAGAILSPSYIAASNEAPIALDCCVAVTRTKAHSSIVTSPIVTCDATLDLVEVSPGSDGVTGSPSGKYVLCSTSGTFLGWICDDSVN